MEDETDNKAKKLTGVWRVCSAYFHLHLKANANWGKFSFSQTKRKEDKRQSVSFGLTTPRKTGKKIKFSNLAIILSWLRKRPGVDDPDLEMADKYLASLRKVGGPILNKRRYEQAKSTYRMTHWLYRLSVSLDFFNPTIIFFEHLKVLTEGNRQAHIPAWVDLIGNGILVEHNLCFAVDFSKGENYLVCFGFS